MKTLKSKLSLVGMAFLSLLMIVSLSSCDENPDVVTQEQILPESFGVDIPSSISNTNFVAGGRVGGRAEDEDLSGNSIYEALSFFIAIGEGSAEIVEDILTSIQQYEIERIRVITYEGDDDGRDKTLVVQENVTFEGVTYEYQLTVTDAQSEGAADGGIGMQVFWNNNPVKGVAILKPYNLDRVGDADAGDAIYRIDYDAAGDQNFDAIMEVRIAGLPLDAPEVDQFSMQSLRMFVGKKGDEVDVFGSSSHPNAELFSQDDDGLNWAFVASGNDLLNIGVAEVGLPPSNLDEDSRDVILKDFSIRNVFEAEIEAEYGTEIDDELLDIFLANTLAPGYFNSDGFVQAQTAPSNEWVGLAERIENLTPYNPLEVTNLTIDFQ